MTVSLRKCILNLPNAGRTLRGDVGLFTGLFCQLAAFYHHKFWNFRHTPGSELLQGLERGGSLKQDTVGFLFCLLLFHWRFPIYLSDQVIEDLRQHSKEEKIQCAVR